MNPNGKISTGKIHPRQIDFNFWKDAAPSWALHAKMTELRILYGNNTVKAFLKMGPKLEEYFDARARLTKQGLVLAILVLVLVIVGTTSSFLFRGASIYFPINMLIVWTLLLVGRFIIEPYEIKKLNKKYNFVVEI